MYCSNCGTKLDDNAKFCPNCGTKVVSAETVQAAAEAAPTVFPVEQSAAQPDTTTLPELDPVLPSPAASSADTAEVPELELPDLSGALDMPVEEPDLTIELPKAAPTPAPSMEPFPIPEAPVFSDVAKAADQAPAAPVYSAPVQPQQPVMNTAAGQNPVQIPAAASFAQQTATPVPGANPPVMPTSQTPQYPASVSGAIPGQNPPTVQKGKKKGRAGLIIAIAAIALVAIIGGAFFASRGGSTKKFDEFMANGDEAYDSGDYESAASYYEQAYEIKPDDEILREQLSETYMQLLYNAVDNDDYETAMAYAGTIDSTVGFASPEEKNGIYNYVYYMWVLSCEIDGDYDKGFAVLEEGKQYLSDEEYEMFYDELTDYKNSGEAGATDSDYLANFAKSVVSHIDEGKYYNVCVDIAFDADGILDAIGGVGNYVTIPVPGSELPYVRFYDTGDVYPVVYYGEISNDGNGVRQGEGYIFTAYDYNGYGLYAYLATWNNDLPDGPFGELNLYSTEGENTFDTEVRYFGNLVHGLYDGEITITWTDGRTYIANYNQGIPEILGHDDENDAPIIAYATDDSGKWLYSTDTTTPVGVDLFG